MDKNINIFIIIVFYFILTKIYFITEFLILFLINRKENQLLLNLIKKLNK